MSKLNNRRIMVAPLRLNKGKVPNMYEFIFTVTVA